MEGPRYLTAELEGHRWTKETNNSHDNGIDLEALLWAHV